MREANISPTGGKLHLGCKVSVRSKYNIGNSRFFSLVNCVIRKKYSTVPVPARRMCVWGGGCRDKIQAKRITIPSCGEINFSRVRRYRYPNENLLLMSFLLLLLTIAHYKNAVGF
jgi:hypothetical protein